MRKFLIFFTTFFFLQNFAFAQTFWDVPNDDPNYIVVESLYNLGVIHGYGDGSFKPDQSVTRVEALKMILASAKIPLIEGANEWSQFPDLEPQAWYLPFVYTAYKGNIVDGNTDGSFAPNRLVNKAEALKMLLMTFEIDLSKHQNLTSPISLDVGSGEWFSPYFSFAKKVLIVSPNFEGMLQPSAVLNRGELASIIYNMVVLHYGGDVQKLLNLAESELIQIIVSLKQGNIDQAIASADAAIFYTDRALDESPNTGIVKAANKISLGFKELCLAYIDGINGELESLQAHVNNAKEFAGAAYADDPSTQALGKEIKEQGDLILSNFLGA